MEFARLSLGGRIPKERYRSSSRESFPSADEFDHSRAANIVWRLFLVLMRNSSMAARTHLLELAPQFVPRTMTGRGVGAVISRC